MRRGLAALAALGWLVTLIRLGRAWWWAMPPDDVLALAGAIACLVAAYDALRRAED